MLPHPTLTPTHILASTSPPVAIKTPSVGANGPLSADQLPAISVYGDTLNKNWTLANSQDMQYNVANQTFVHDGHTAIVSQPKKSFGKLFFSVQKDSAESYSRNKVLGLRFWLSGGTHSIATSDLAVTVLGSNQYTYWNNADNSVKIDATITPESPLFSETRLYDLGINTTIPPKTWVEVIVWLDSLQFDPEYKYVTGFYVKNDQGNFDPFYLDHIDLLLQP